MKKCNQCNEDKVLSEFGRNNALKNGIQNKCKPCILVTNLEIVTKSENELHAFLIGLKSHKGEQHNRSKLTLANVEDIRNLLCEGVTALDIAEKYKVSRGHVYHIKNGRSWD